jgi:hypothetical protein
MPNRGILAKCREILAFGVGSGAVLKAEKRLEKLNPVHTPVLGMILPVTDQTGFVLLAPLSILFFHFFAVVGLA